MKAKLLIILILTSCIISFSCSKDDTPTSSSSDCQTDQSKRKGAMCKDGSTSNSTGSGACSGHGGVDYWLCK
jgi:hypothetical protein